MKGNVRKIMISVDDNVPNLRESDHEMLRNLATDILRNQSDPITILREQYPFGVPEQPEGPGLKMRQILLSDNGDENPELNSICLRIHHSTDYTRHQM
jgi:hypothetical protein